MADRVGQLLPAVAALGGVALTFVGTAWLELQKYRAARRDLNEERCLRAFSDLVQTITEIGRRLQTAGDELAEGVAFDVGVLVRDTDDLVKQARHEAAVARLVGPRQTLELIVRMEEEVGPLHGLTVDVRNALAVPSGIESDRVVDLVRSLVNLAKRLLRFRDALVDSIRDSQRLS